MSNKTQTAEGEDAKGKAVTLPSGALAELREPNGRDLQHASDVAGSANSMALLMAVAGQVATIDGKRIVYEDVLEMPMGDVMALIGALGGNDRAPSPASATKS